MTAVKIVTVLGTSTDSWEAAAQEALNQSKHTIDDTSGLEMEDWTATVEDGAIAQYKATAKIAFPVHSG